MTGLEDMGERARYLPLLAIIVNFFAKLRDQRERANAVRAAARSWLAALPPGFRVIFGSWLLIVAFQMCCVAADAPTLARVERDLGRPLYQFVWTERWATFRETAHVAAAAGLHVEQLERLTKQYPWMLQDPPALSMSVAERQSAQRFGAGSVLKRTLSDFVTDSRAAAGRIDTRVQLTADDGQLRLEFDCAEPAMDLLRTRAADPSDAFERAVLAGDSRELYEMVPRVGRVQLIDRIRVVPPRKSSLFEDDCVFVRLVPLLPGEDLSRENRVRDQRDPAGLLRELGPLAPAALRLEGSFYTLAVNAAGAVHCSFYEPWDGGRYWGCWNSHVMSRCRRTNTGWHVSLTLPWEALHPLLSRGAIWGLDIYRHRPARHDMPEQLMRVRKTTLLRFQGDGRQIERRLVARGVDEASLTKWPHMWERTEVASPETHVAAANEPLSEPWPSEDQWGKCHSLRPLRDWRTGSVHAAQTHVRLLQTPNDLFVRFDCSEPDRTELRVVTRQQVRAVWPEGHRALNWLDRREGPRPPNWGDHVEVQLAPGLDGSDPYHNGYYLILVNTRGDVLSRYFDPFGAYSVDVDPWDAKTRVRFRQDGHQWTIDVAIPWSSFFGLQAAGKTWFGNFLRHRPMPGGKSLISTWAVPYGTIRDPGCLGRLNLTLPPLPQRTLNVPRFWPGVPTGKLAAKPPDHTAPNGHKLDRSRDRVTGVALAGCAGIVAVGDRGTVWHGATAGDSWQCGQAGAHFNLQRVQMSDARHGWAVGGWLRDKRVALCGGMGAIYRTCDAGHTWQPLWQNQGPWLYDLALVNEQVGYVCGGYGTVMKTIDSGLHWQGPLPTGTNSWLYGIGFVDAENGWAVGSHETLLHTSDGGRTWQRQQANCWRRPADVRQQLRAVHFVDLLRGWVVGDHGTILHTGDGGRHWKRQPIPLEDEMADLMDLRDVFFIDQQVGWAVGLFGSVVLRTENGGRCWTFQPTGFHGGLTGVVAADRTHVWAVGERGARLNSQDGGHTWKASVSEARPVWVILTPHDHHLNNWAGMMTATADHVDWAVVRPGRGAFYFESFMDYYQQRFMAGTQSLGSVFNRDWADFIGSRRRQPHYIHHAYETYRGTRPLALRVTALLRLLQPEVVITEWPVFAEGYWAWETALIPRCAQIAFRAAGDPSQFPELSQMGLKPWRPAELYTSAGWYNQGFGLRPGTHQIIPHNDPSRRLGSLLQAARRSSSCWEGIMDRGTAQIRGWLAQQRLHLAERNASECGLMRDGLGITVERLSDATGSAVGSSH